jgi:hypothetical protein
MMRASVCGSPIRRSMSARQTSSRCIPWNGFFHHPWVGVCKTARSRSANFGSSDLFDIFILNLRRGLRHESDLLKQVKGGRACESFHHRSQLDNGSLACPESVLIIHGVGG